MKLFLLLVSVNLILAMAVAGLLQVRRTNSGITIHIETALLSAWYRSIKEVAGELISTMVHRDRASSDDIPASRPCLNSRKHYN